MSRSKQGLWGMAAMGFLVAVAQLVLLPRQVWPQLGVLDWGIIALLLAAPLVSVWQHLRHVREITTEVWSTGIRLALGGDVPFWFGLGLVRRVLNG